MSTKKRLKPQWVHEGGKLVAKDRRTHAQKVEDNVKAHRRADREDAIANGTLMNGPKHAVHGGDVKTRNRRERRQSRIDARNGRFDD